MGYHAWIRPELRVPGRVGPYGRIFGCIVLAISISSTPSLADRTNDAHGAASRRLKQFEGQALYAIEPGYRCTGPGPGAAAIASWRGKLEIRDGQVIDWGDRCNNEGLPAATKDIAFGFWGRSIRYRGLVYRPARDIERKLQAE